MSRLDNTRRCPLAPHCEACGDAGDLTIVTARTEVGVPCLTLCQRCREQGRAPAWPLPEAVRRVLHHCTHLRITVDEMAELLRRENQPPT